jgi:Lamin Tail Domain
MSSSRHWSVLTATLLVGAASLPSTATAASVASSVRISAVRYDSPGSDRGGNASLNAEWVRITNFGGSRRHLTGWTLRDTSRHVYRFGRFTLAPHSSVKVHTGTGRDTATNLYWDRHWYVWNNDGDTATLRNRAGVVVSVRRW